MVKVGVGFIEGLPRALYKAVARRLDNLSWTGTQNACECMGAWMHGRMGAGDAWGRSEVEESASCIQEGDNSQERNTC